MMVYIKLAIFIYNSKLNLLMQVANTTKSHEMSNNVS